jgi:hypothetical protein
MAARLPELTQAQAKRVLLAQVALTIAVPFWIGACQHPPLVAIALHIALPWLAVGMVMVYPKQLAVFLDSDTRQPLSAAWFLNMIALVVLFRCVSFTDWTQAVWVGCIPGAALFAIGLIVEWPSRSGPLGLAFVMFFSVGYGYGAVRELDVLLDRSPAIVVRSTILEKSRFKAYALQVEPWGDVQQIKNVLVPESVYQSVEKGGSICMVLRRGAFGIGWYTAQACPWTGSEVALGPGLQR